MNKEATAPEAPPSYQETMGQQPYPNASAGAGTKNNFLPFECVVALTTQRGLNAYSLHQAYQLDILLKTQGEKN